MLLSHFAFGGGMRCFELCTLKMRDYLTDHPAIGHFTLCNQLSLYTLGHLGGLVRLIVGPVPLDFHGMNNV
jgi:hypothetical protein